MIPLYNTDGVSTCPLGLPMNQNRMAVPIWSYAMEIHPPANIFEIGTAGGGFTFALGIHALLIKAQIYSFDICECPDERWAAFCKLLPVKFIRGDVFEEKNAYALGLNNEFGLLHMPGRKYVLCDGGNKPKEFKAVAHTLRSGDIIAAHDYFCGDPAVWCCSEITKADVADTVKQFGLEPFMQEHFDLAGWLAFIKK